jgi:hypothetical protein
MRRSKALHLLNSRRVISEKGAVDDIEVARREWAKADGWIETNPGLKMEPDDNKAMTDFKGQLEMLQESKGEIENFGPNPALIGQGLEDSSGRAIALLQQAGMAELGPYLSSFKNWKIRVYRCIWNIITEHWKAERWIRVTDDQNVAQFFQINKLDMGPNGQPAIVNAIGSMDVDFIIDEGPDTINMQADNAATLQALGPQFSQQFPELAIELSPLQSTLKSKMLKKIEAAKAQPPPPDPKVLALQEQAKLEQQKAVEESQRKQAEFIAEQQRLRDKAEFDRMQAGEQAAFDWHLQEQRFINEAELKRREAANQIEIDRIKANAGIEMAREKGEVDAEIARTKAKAKPAKAAAE